MNKVYKTIQERGDFVTDYVANGSFKSIKDHVQYNYSEDFAVLVRLVDYSNNFRGPFVYVDKNSYNFLSKSALIPGDLIISNVGENVGTVFQAPKLSKPMTLGPNSILVRMADGNKDFWYYWFNSSEGQQKLKSIVSSSAQPKFNKTAFKTLRIPIINNIVQKKIVTILKNLDLKIELNNQINAELEAMAKLIYDYWFVQFDFPDKNGKPYKSSGGKMVFSEELKREIPEGWEVENILKIVDWIGGSQPPKSTFKHKPHDNYVRFIQNRDYANNQNITYIPVSESNKLCDKFDIMMDKYGEAGKTRFGLEGAYNVALSKIKVNLVNGQEYIRKFLESSYIFNYLYNACMASTRASLNENILGNLNIVIPNSEILKTFEKFQKLIIKKILQNRKESEQLSKLRDWLLPMLMNGQVKVKN